MKTHIKVVIGGFAVAVIVALVVFLLPFFGEESSSDSIPVSLAVAYGNRSNSSISSQHLEAAKLSGDTHNVFVRAGTPGSQMAVITTDGQPVHSAQIEVPPSTAITAVQMASDARFFADRNIEKTLQSRVGSSDADPLTAMSLAADWLQSQPQDNMRILLFADSGISTHGDMSFLNPGILTASPQNVVSELSERNRIPDLSDVTVLFVGLGSVYSPQLPIDNAALLWLQELWTLIVREGGGEAEIISARFPPSTPDSDFPVSVVNFPESRPITFAYAEQIESNFFKQAQFLGEEQVRFRGDSSEFLDAQAAKTSIRPIAEYMLSNPSFSILVVGNTAGDGPLTESSIALSHGRAERVKAALIGFGVSEDRIFTAGLGNSSIWHVPGLGTTSPLASQNRRVVLIDASTPIAQDIISNPQIFF